MFFAQSLVRMYGEKVANAGCSSWSLDCGTNKSNPHMKKKHSFCDDIGVYCAITKLYFLVPPLTSNLQYIFSNRERIDEKGKCERDDVTFCFIFFFSLVKSVWVANYIISVHRPKSISTFLFGLPAKNVQNVINQKKNRTTLGTR